MAFEDDDSFVPHAAELVAKLKEVPADHYEHLDVMVMPRGARPVVPQLLLTVARKKREPDAPALAPAPAPKPKRGGGRG